MPTPSRAAVQFERGGTLRIAMVEVADPGAGEVLIRLAASGLCHTDLHLMEGAEPPIGFRLPAIHGHEAIGTIAATGPNSPFAVGDTVMPYVLPECGRCPFCRSGRTNLCFEFARGLSAASKAYVALDGEPVGSVGGIGTFSEYLCIRDDQVIAVNPAAPVVPACCIGCAVTTGIASVLIDAQVRAGSSVVVIGTGGVGLNIVQGARIAEARLIVAVDSNPDKEAAARRFGATHFITAGAADVPAEVLALTGYGADYAFDTVGTAAVLRQGLACLHDGGYARMVRVAVDAEPGGTIRPSELGNKTYATSLMGGARRVDVARYVDWFVEGRIDLDGLVTHRLPLDAINDGFDLMRAGTANRVVVTLA